MFMHEEAKIIGLPVNERATLLLWNQPNWRFQDVIMGDVIVAGLPDDDGETQEAPGSPVNLLLNHDTYWLYVEHGEDERRWSDPFGSYFDAIKFGSALQTHSPRVTGFRVSIL